MILDEGDKVFASTRRLFEAEYPSYFVGLVESANDGSARVLGHVYVWDPYRNGVVKREGQRRQVISFSSPHFILHPLERELDLEQVNFKSDTNGRIWLTDGDRTIMELAERAATGAH